MWTQTIINGIPYTHENIKCKYTCILTIILAYNNYKHAMFLILGGWKMVLWNRNSSPVITFLCIYKRVVSKEKYYISFVIILVSCFTPTVKMNHQLLFRVVIKFFPIPSLFYLLAINPPVGQGVLIRKVSRSHTRRTIVGRSPLDGWSVRRRDLYLTTHNTHNRHTSLPPAGFEPTISAGERTQIYALDRAATGIGFEYHRHTKYIHFQ